MIIADPAALNDAASQLGASASQLSDTLSGLNATYASLDGWSGSGSGSFGELMNRTRNHIIAGQSALSYARDAVSRYAGIVEQARVDWQRTDSRETELAHELTRAKTDLAVVEQEITDLQVALMRMPAVAVGVSAPGLVSDQNHITHALPGLVQQQQRLTQQIQALEAQIQHQQHLKQEYEALVKRASDDVTQSMREAQNIWPTVNSSPWPGGNGFMGACVAGYGPPAPGGGGGGVLGWVAAAATVIVTIPLDETGLGEGIDAGVIGEVTAGAAADAGGGAVTSEAASMAAETGTGAVAGGAGSVASRAAGLAARVAGGGVGNVAISDLLNHRLDTNPVTNAINFAAGGLPWAAPTELLTRTLPFTEAAAQGSSTAADEVAQGRPVDPTSVIISTAEGAVGGAGDAYLFHVTEDAKALRAADPAPPSPSLPATVRTEAARQVTSRLRVMRGDAAAAAAAAAIRQGNPG